MTEKKKELDQKVYETLYSIDELTAEPQKVFGTNEVIAKAALKMAGRVKYTEKEAARIVESFRKKEVK